MEAVEEAADHIVGLTRAAMPGAEMEALEAILMRLGVGHGGGLGRAGRQINSDLERWNKAGTRWKIHIRVYEGGMRPEELNPLFAGPKR
jgi:hypothetical protein